MMRVQIKHRSARAAPIAVRAFNEHRDDWQQGDHASDADGGRNLFPFDPDPRAAIASTARSSARCAAPRGA